MYREGVPRTDAALLEEFRSSGNRALLQVLYVRHNPMLRHLAGQLLGGCGRDRDLVEQVTEEPWLQLLLNWQTLAGYDCGRGSFCGFLRLLLGDAVKLHFRRQQRAHRLHVRSLAGCDAALLAARDDGEANTYLADFETTLTGSEVRYLRELIFREPLRAGCAALSLANGRKLAQRVRRKWERYAKDG